MAGPALLGSYITTNMQALPPLDMSELLMRRVNYEARIIPEWPLTTSHCCWRESRRQSFGYKD